MMNAYDTLCDVIARIDDTMTNHDLHDAIMTLIERHVDLYDVDQRAHVYHDATIVVEHIASNMRDNIAS